MTNYFDEEQQIQEQHYEYPYNSLPRVEGGNFSQTEYWSWEPTISAGCELFSTNSLTERSIR